MDYLKNYKSNPNQRFYEKNPIPEYKEGDKSTVYSKINVNSMGKAMKDLTPAHFKVWMYLAKNQSGKVLAVSPADANNWGGISKDTFQKAFRELIAKGYLTLKEGSTNSYIFREEPIDEEEVFVEKVSNEFEF